MIRLPAEFWKHWLRCSRLDGIYAVGIVDIILNHFKR